MSEPVEEAVESSRVTGATQRTPPSRNTRRKQLLAVLRTPEGRRQALLLADILALPLAMRPRRAVGRRVDRRRG
jgi:hypothetical protein